MDGLNNSKPTGSVKSHAGMTQVLFLAYVIFLMCLTWLRERKEEGEGYGARWREGEKERESSGREGEGQVDG